ncbi:MAG: chitobiase/beta-hexosaminidase C-terminal domain-containing protein [Candidatus Aminicenantes bacterium]|nr:chitobiase/beta-hexosaminidase C-terminal domain-containing protein [Candidatus Aminicenantes bacterium]
MNFFKIRQTGRVGQFLCPAVLILMGISVSGCGTPKAEWKPGEVPLKTRWTGEVSPADVLSEYPRPQMVRQDWLNLNGLWEFAVISRDVEKPDRFDRKILVPFPVESALSGVCERINKSQKLWYRRSFNIPENWREKNILLHFGAADWETGIWVNGQKAGFHRGGYDSFFFDITTFLEKGASQELVVAVWDPTNEGGQPVGKQKNEPGGIFYTPTSGIWRTVWMEPVPTTHVRSLRLGTDKEKGNLFVDVEIFGPITDIELKVSVNAAGHSVAEAKGLPCDILEIIIPEARLWSPDDPFLYDLEVSLVGRDERDVDSLKSYFGIRGVSVGKGDDGINRLFLNKRPIFMLGPLDQGFWPDGLYTAPTDEALRYDLEVMKKMGFNMVRKHVKVEPERWYYWCDKLGLLVWQDMPNGGNKTREDKQNFELEMERVIRNLINHPSIVMWVPFNEGWGQYDSARMVQKIRELDPSRLVDHASGWHDRGIADVVDIHSYPEPRSPQPEILRAAVLGEFGGLGLNIPGHTWKKGWGYDLLQDRENLINRYEQLFSLLLPLIETPGLSAAVYTQITDIETENNGLITYDREIIKIPLAYAGLAHKGYFPPRMKGKSRIFIDSIRVDLACFRQGAKIFFTTDGTEPQRYSLLYTKPFILENSAVVKTRAFWDNGAESRVASYNIERVSPIGASEGKDFVPGLARDVYHGEWRELPDFDELSPDSRQIVEGLNIDSGIEQYFALKWQGYVRVPRTGIYVFYSASDDGSRIFIAGQQVVDNDGVHGEREKWGAVALEKGFHSVAMFYFQRTGGRMIRISVEGPGLEKQEIPSSWLFHNNRE